MRELIDDAEEARAIGNPALASVSLRWGFHFQKIFAGPKYFQNSIHLSVRCRIHVSKFTAADKPRLQTTLGSAVVSRSERCATLL